MAEAKDIYSVSKLMEILIDLGETPTSIQVGDVHTPEAYGKHTATVIAGMGEEEFFLHTPHFKWMCKKLSGNTIRIKGGRTVQPYFDKLEQKLRAN